jgi:tryptophanyl-tRNA synthetase
LAVSRIFSGIQPTGELHLGNYFGAVRNWAQLQDEYEQTIYCVVDYHAITHEIDADGLLQRSIRLAGDLIACGIDPDRSILFIQSHVPEHTELAWVFSAFTAHGDLSRMTQFKDKSERSGYVNAGLFTYPVLQAADILLYRSDGVPVGDDQSQHLELTRGIAHRFNQTVGTEFFPNVETILTAGSRIMSLAEPTQKMSKSLGHKHYIGVMEPERSAIKKIRSAVTDSGGTASGQLSAGVSNLIGILRLMDADALAEQMSTAAQEGELMYGDLKTAVAEHLMAALEPIRARRAELTDGDIAAVLRTGAGQAREIAAETMSRVRRLIGVGRPC